MINEAKREYKINLGIIMYFTWVSVGTIDEAHREYVLSASLGRKKRGTETDKRKPRDQHKNGLDPKTGFDHPKPFDLSRFLRQN